MDVVVVDHYDSYTWNLVHLIASVTGVLPAVVQHDSDADLSAFSHIVLSPGPGHPDEYDWSVFGRGLPVLGVCLGMQGLVRSCGGVVARVAPAHGEVALVTHDGVGVFAEVPSPLKAVRYHSLAATSLPDSLVESARSGGVVMGVRHRTLPLEGVQFHPESILSEHGVRLVANLLGVRL